MSDNVIDTIWIVEKCKRLTIKKKKEKNNTLVDWQLNTVRIIRYIAEYGERMRHRHKEQLKVN